MIQVDCTTAIR